MAPSKDDTKPADEKAAPRLRRIGLMQLASAVVVIAVLFAAYAITVSNRLEQVDKHNLRTLAQMGAALEKIIGNSKTTIKSLKKPGYVCEFFKRQSRLELAGQTACDEVQAIIDKAKESATDGSEDETNAKSDEAEASASGDSEVEINLTPVRLEADQGLLLRVRIEPTRKIGEKNGETDTLEELRLKVNLPEILEATSFGAAFQSVLVADPAGRVIHQHKPPAHALFQPPGQHQDVESDSVAVGDLTKLPLSKKPKDKSAVFAQIDDSTSVNDVTLAGASYTLMCQPLALNTLFEISEKSGESQGESVGPNWHICGLVDEGQSVRRSLEVASPLAIAMFAFVLIGILGWPIVKLVTMQSRERMRFVELYVAMLATIAILMVGTVLFLNADRAIDIAEASIAQLEDLARQIDGNIHDEFRQARDQAIFYDKILKEEVTAKSESESEGEKTSGSVLRTSNELPWLTEKILAIDNTQLLPKAYPYLTQVFWMRLDEGGKQVIKATVRDENTPAISVSSRDYFKAAKEGRLWHENGNGNGNGNCSGEGESEGDCYYVQAFSSLTTGEFSAALSMASKVDTEIFSDGHGVSEESNKEEYTKLGIALSLRPLSVMYPVLAPGVGFAIIDNETGTALFHSNDRHATVENLFKDEGIADRLRAAIRSGVDAHFSGLYRTRPHRIFVRAMSPEPWSIVMFSDAEISRTSNLEALSLAIMLISAHLLVFGIVTGMYLIMKGRDTPGWTWPMAHWEHENRIALYRGACNWLLACGVAMICVVCLLPVNYVLYAVMSQQLAIIAVLLLFGLWRKMDQSSANALERSGRLVLYAALLASVICVTVFGARGWLIPLAIAAISYFLIPSRWWTYRLWGYRASFMLVWLVVSIPPSVGYYKFAHDRDLSVLSELEQDYSKRAQEYRQASFQHDFKNFAGADVFTTESFRRRERCVERPAGDEASDYVASARDCYRIHDAGLTHYLRVHDDAETPAATVDENNETGIETLGKRIERTLDRHLPIYNEMTSYSRYRGLGAPGRPDGNGIASHAYRMPFGIATVLGGTVMLMLLWAWVGYGARRLFFGELNPHTQALTVADIVAHNVKRHTIATLATRAQYAFLAEDSSRHWLYDLSQTASLDALENLEGDEAILCTHLGDALHNDKLRLRVLGLLERLAHRTQGNVIVVTSVPIGDTQSSETTQVDGDSSDGRQVVFPFKADGESARWYDLLSHFQSVDVSIHGKVDARICNKTLLTQLPDKDWLACELDAIAGLRNIMGPDHEETLTQPLTRREIIKEIGRRAKWFYQSLWDNCTSGEKLVLTQLSREGVVNPREVNAVRALLARGLLRMDPVLKPINNSFGRFVASAFDLAEVQRLESRGDGKGLNKRSVLMGLILIVMLFLWFTQRDVVETWIAYIGAIAVGMSAVLRMMDGVKGGGQQG